MFKIEKLLSLFPDEETKNIFLYSYYLSQEKNKDLSNSVFERLLLLKTINPRLNIILDTTKEKSYFRADNNVIYLNNLSIETFFHELTHLLSYNFSYFQVPNEYYLFKNNFSSASKNTDLMIDLLNLCKKTKKHLLHEINSEINDVKSKNIKIMQDNIKQEPQSTEFNTITCIEGIIDSIMDGWSHTYGLTYQKENNYIAKKSKKSSGHSYEYFSNTHYQFEEILANYCAIKLTNPNNNLFEILKNIIGNEFVSFLDQRCSEICTSFLNKNIDTNNIKK